jgi:hypothetical protein
MAARHKYCVEWLKDREVKRRGLAWLISQPQNPVMTAKEVFHGLSEKAQRELNNRFDAWIDGDKPNKKWYHPWDEKGFENVWVFKYQEHRFFAFMCHPEPEDDSFAMCVLVSYTEKTEWKADQLLKDLMQDLSKDAKFLKAAEEVEEECFKKKTKEWQDYAKAKTNKALD